MSTADAESTKPEAVSPGGKRKSTEHSASEEPEAKKVNLDKGCEPSDAKIHSANDWESANLQGGDERKQKFLRLMGAAKKDHKGTFIIGDSEPHKEHLRSPADRNSLEKELESQYQQSMTAHLSRRDAKHRGLGYHGESEADVTSTSDAAKNDAETTADNECKEDKNGEKQSEDTATDDNNETKSHGDKAESSETKTDTAKHKD